jgi:DNA-binding MarR family transcriptional regulator
MRDEVPRAQTPEFLKEAPGFLIRELFQSYTAGWTRYIDGTLTGPQYSVLAVLMDHDGSDQVSVAQAASLDASTMVSVARRLERRGLIIRTRSLRDGRRKVLQITSLGEELFRKARARVLVFDEELFAHDPARKEEIISELSRLARHWRQMSPVEDLGELE